MKIKLKKKWKFLGRDADGDADVYVYTKKPIKNEVAFEGEDCFYLAQEVLDLTQFKPLTLYHRAGKNSWEPYTETPGLKVDDKVLVQWRSDGIWSKRYFSHFTETGEIACFKNGYTSWLTKETTEWDEWKLPEKEE